MKDGEKYFEGRVALKAIIRAPSGKVLIMQNARFDGELWDLPGGTLNEGEVPEEALLREIHEELGITPTVVRPLVVDTFSKPKTGKEVVVIIYEAALSEELNDFIMEEDEVTGVQWIGKGDISIIKLFPEYHKALENFFSGQNS